MRCCIHIVTDSERIVDPDGEEFADIEAAQLEACQSARDLMAGELVGGRPVPLGWQAQIASTDGTVLLTVPFVSLVFSDNDAFAKVLQSLPRVTDPVVMERAKDTLARVRKCTREINASLGEISSQLRTLARMSGQA